jgi:hypothetical protein
MSMINPQEEYDESWYGAQAGQIASTGSKRTKIGRQPRDAKVRAMVVRDRLALKLLKRKAAAAGGKVVEIPTSFVDAFGVTQEETGYRIEYPAQPADPK